MKEKYDWRYAVTIPNRGGRVYKRKDFAEKFAQKEGGFITAFCVHPILDKI